MLRRLLIAWLALAAVLSLLCWGLATEANLLQMPFTTGGPAGCTVQANTFIARTTGENTSAITTLICGLVTDGLIDSTASMASTGTNPYCGNTGVLDRLFLLAMANQTDALLDVCGHPSATLSATAPTFAANAGFTGGNLSTTIYIDTGMNPTAAGGRYTLNSAHIQAWAIGGSVLTGSDIGASSNPATTDATINMGYTDSTAYLYINQDATSTSTTITGAIGGPGSMIFGRSGAASTNVFAYFRGAAAGISSPQASSSMPNFDFYLLNSNKAGTPIGGSSRQIAAASIGSALTAAQVMTGTISSGTGLVPRLCTYLTAVHGSC